MSRKWVKCIPPKKLQEITPVYKGVWMPQMDRYWESDDGYNVMSRQIKTSVGVIEHITIGRLGGFNIGGSGEVPWSVKQEIKDELFGVKRIAIEVFPSRKHLVDVCDVYHLWLLPKDYTMPFGIHPIRDPQCDPVERGYDFDLDKCKEWTDSPERAALIDKGNAVFLENVMRLIGDGEYEIHTLRSQ